MNILKKREVYTLGFYIHKALNSSFLILNVGIVLSEKPSESKKYDYDFVADNKSEDPNKFSASKIIDKPVKHDFYIDPKFGHLLTADLEIVPSKMKEWEFVQWTYVANGGEKYITIGNFVSDNKTNVKKVKYRLRQEPMLDNRPYVLIDDVYVKSINQIDEDPRIETEEQFLLSNANFEFNSHKLNLVGLHVIDSLLDSLKYDIREYDIKVVGHADNLGTDIYNKNLGYKRAESVTEYLKFQAFNIENV